MIPFKALLILVIPAFLFSGCSTSGNIYSVDQENERLKLNRSLEDKSVRIHTNDGMIIYAGNTRVEQDSIYFYTVNSSAKSISVAKVDRITEKSGIRPLTVLGVGGIAAGVIIAGNQAKESSVSTVSGVAGGIILAGLGVILTIISASKGVPTYYIRK